MNNLDTVSDLQKEVAKSAGSAQQKMDEVYGQSTEAKINKLKNSTQQLYMSMFNSKVINGILGHFNSIIKSLNTIVNSSKITQGAILALTTAIISLGIAIKITGVTDLNKKLSELVPSLIKAIKNGTLLSTVLGGIGKAFTFLASPVGGITAALGIGAIAMVKYINHQRELKQQTEDLKTSYDSLNRAMKENDVNSMESDTSNLKKKQNEYKELLNKRKELENRLKNVDKLDMSDMEKTTASNIIAKQLSDVNKKIEEQADVWDKAGYTIDKATGEVQELSQAQSLLENNEIANSIREQSQAEIDNRDEIIKLIQEYQELGAVENKNAIQKERVSQLSEILTSKIGGLVVSKDKEGNTTIKNTDLLDKEIEMLNTEKTTVETLTAVKLEQAKNNATIEIGSTKTTYAEVKKRIELYKEEMGALSDLANKGEMNDLVKKYQSGAKLTKEEELKLNNMTNYIMYAGVRDSVETDKLQKYIDQIDKIYNSEVKGIDKTTDSLNNGYIPANDEAGKSTKENTKAVNAAKDAIRDYDNALKSLDNTIYKLETNMSNMDDTSQTYRDALSQEIKLLEQKNKTLNDGMTIGKNQINVSSKLPKISNSSTARSSSSNKNTAKDGYSSADSFINDIMPYAQSVKSKYNVPVSLLLAQAMSESANGTSPLARTDNNYFGMTWTGKNGQKGSPRPKSEGGHYVHYNSMEESVEAYGKLLASYYGINGDSFDSGLQKVVNKGYAASPNYKNLVKSKYNQYNLGKYDTESYKGTSSGNSSSISSDNSVETEIDSFKSQVEDYEKQIIDNKQKIEESKIKWLNSQIGDYDKQISQADLKISVAQTNAELYNEGTEQKTQYLTEQWKAINESYALMAKKEQALESAIKSGNYTEKTVADLKIQLAEIKNEGLSTIKDLHDAFTEAFDAQYSSKVSGNKNSIKEIEWELDNLDEKSADASKRKYELNKSLLEQQEKIKQKTLEQIKIVEEMLAKEKYESTKQVWRNQLDKLKGFLRETKQSTEQIRNNLESSISNMRSSIESLQSSIVSALKAQYNDEIKALQEKINILQNDTPDKQNRLSALQKELKEWEKDDSQFSKSKQSELRSEIKKVDKELQIADLQSQIKQKQDESEDSKLNKEAIKIMKRGDTTEINNLLEEWLPEYKNKFDLFGEDYKTVIAEQTNKQLYEFKNFSSIAEDIRSKLYEINNESYTENSSAKDSFYKEVKHNEDGTIGTISENKYGTKFVTYIYKGQERSAKVDGIYDPNSADFIGYVSGGESQNTGLHWLDGKIGKPERVLSSEQTSAFNDLVYNKIPKLKLLNFDNLLIRNITLPDFSKLIPKKEINLDQPFIKNEISIINNTPFDVDNNMSNLEKALKQQIGSRLGFIG